MTYKIGFIITTLAVLANFSVNLLADYHQRPEQITVAHSDDPVIEQYLNIINEVCEGCIFKDPGFFSYKVTVRFKELENPAYMGLAHINPFYCTIDLPPSYKNTGEVEMFLTLLHEVGHCAGFEHDSAIDSVMSPYSGNISLDNIVYFIELMKGK
jgi:hypothetical protein